MKVLHFFKTYWPDSFGGIERMIFTLASAGQSVGYSAEVLTLSSNPEPRALYESGHRILRARQTANIASTGLSVEAISMFRAAAAQADIVHYHFPWPFMDVAHFAVRHGKKCVLTYHSDVVKQKLLSVVYAPLRQRFFGEMAAIVATSPNYVDTSPILKPLSDKTVVVPLGLEETSYPTASQAQIDHWRARIPRPFVVFVGEFRYYKGLDVLLDAAPNVAADIVLVGAGPMERSLRARIERENLLNVHMAGRLNDADKLALISLADAVVLPSNRRSEAFGLALVEAAMMARPMISCEIGTGTSFVNLHRQTGLVVSPDDADALAGAINEIVASEQMRAQFGANARLRFEKKFTGRVMAENYARIYESVLSGTQLR